MNTQKEQIADTFQKHFNHFGYKKTSVDDIAKELKVSKKTIYQHFSSKEEILYYVVYRIADQFRHKMEIKLDKFPAYPNKLAELIRLIFAESRKWLKQKNDPFEFTVRSLIFFRINEIYLPLMPNNFRQNANFSE